MISKEARDKDRAICEAATPDWREGAVAKWHLYCRATHPERLDNERVLMRANEHFPYEADVKAAAHCRNRLPLYIADAEEMERRVAAVERAVADTEAKATHWRAETDYVRESIERAKADGLREALKILRGEK